MPMRQDSTILDGDVFLDRCAPALAQLHALWESKHVMDALPARAAFDPVEFRPWLGRLGLLDVLAGALPDGADFRYRLIGTGIVVQVGCDLTGERVSNASMTADIPAALANLRAICANRAPRWRDDLVLCVDGTRMAGERLYLPLASDGENVDMILFCMLHAREADGSPAVLPDDPFWSQLA
jgi:hypothetical protein